jgi:alkylhydroperoxidase/carboxymuconolactone decarboxylase family protein
MKAHNLGTLTGPVLLFGGAYSNFDALRALRAEAERLGIPASNVICCGDTPGYCAEPKECLDMMEDWGCPAIAGNVETNLVNGTDDCGCGFGDGSRCDMFAKLWYTYAVKNVNQINLAYMAGLPDLLRFEYAGKKVVVLHGSPDQQAEFVWRSTSADKKANWGAAAGAEIVVGGHSGLPFAEIVANSSAEAGDSPDSSAEWSGTEGGKVNVTKTISTSPDSSAEWSGTEGGKVNVTKTINTSPDSSAEWSGTEAAARRTSQLLRRASADELLWLNAGVIGMPANDGTPRTWFLTLDDTDGFDYTFRPLDYDHRAAKAKMIDDRRLPVAYAATLTTGIWDNTEIMPPAEESREGLPLNPAMIKAEATAAELLTLHPATAPKKAGHPPQNSQKMNSYSDPKDLKSFGKIAEWQEEMGEKFFDYYRTVTEGDSALTAREKALIALAVSHAIQCSYCIEAYTTNSLQSGADEEQMMEAVHVAAAVKAGTTLIYARQMQRQVDKVVM